MFLCYNHPDEGNMGKEEYDPLCLRCSGEMEGLSMERKYPAIVRHVFHGLVFLSSVYPSYDENRQRGEEGDIDTMIHGYPDDGNGIGKKTAEEVRVEKIGDKEKDMPLGGDFRMLFDERICEIGVVLRDQKEPPEKKIGDRCIVSHFLGYHISCKK